MHSLSKDLIHYYTKNLISPISSFLTSVQNLKMGSNCSCLGSALLEENQINTEKNYIEIDKNMAKSIESAYKANTDIRDFSVDIRVELGDIIILQSLLRGFIERKRVRLIYSSVCAIDSSTNKKSKFAKPPELQAESLFRKEVEEMDLLNVPDYSNTATKMIKTKRGPFIYREYMDEEVISRGPVRMENDAIYTGQWNSLNQRCGKGVQLWTDGSTYEGYWESDRASGKGRLIHANGDVYEGNWKEDKAHGQGIYIHTDGAKYEGYWVNDKQHGLGIEVWPDGARYHGLYENGQKHGKGKFGEKNF